MGSSIYSEQGFNRIGKEISTNILLQCHESSSQDNRLCTHSERHALVGMGSQLGVRRRLAVEDV
jgi:hypothetical protein